MMNTKNLRAIELDPYKVNSTTWVTLEEVLAAVSLSRTNLWMQIERGEFPRPVRWKTRIFWDEAEIDRWIATRPTVPSRSPA